MPSPSQRYYNLQQQNFYQSGGRGVRSGFWEKRPDDFTGPEYGIAEGAASWTQVNPAQVVRQQAMSPWMREQGANFAGKRDRRRQERKVHQAEIRERNAQPQQPTLQTPRPQVQMGGAGAEWAKALGPGPRPIGAIENTGFAGELGPGEPLRPMGARGPAEFSAGPEGVTEKTMATPREGSPTTRPMTWIDTTATDAPAPETTTMKPIPARNKATRQGTGIQSKGRGRVGEMLAGASKLGVVGGGEEAPEKPKGSTSAMGVPLQSIGNPWGRPEPKRIPGTPVQSIGNPWAYDPRDDS